MKLKNYLKNQGHGSQISLAKAINSHAPDVSDWASGHRNVPIDKAVAIELATNGEVTRKDLRPDDWERIWPELAEKVEG